uniref:PAGE family member 1 n=1 Tax=Papio anubis TaxID=9555 RepID=A0A096MSK3_PAPAN
MGFQRKLIYRRRPRMFVESSESSDEQPEEVESPTQSQDSTQEGEDEGASEAQGQEPEADSQEPVLPKTDYELVDGPDAKKVCLRNPEQMKLPAEGPEPEADSQEQVDPKTGCERGDGPDVQELGLPNPEEVKTPEEGSQSIRHANCKVSVSAVSYYNYYYFFETVSLCQPGWSALVPSWLTGTSAS